MTVTYTAEVATGKGFATFLKLLARWRGSVYKLVWRDLLIFLGIYFTFSFLYRFVLTDIYKSYFEELVVYCYAFGHHLPLSFVLGFYVTIVIDRWWEQYITIPWPDSIAVFVSSHIHGQDERARVMRRSIMRYVCLCLALAFILISPSVKKRFPTLQHIVDAGFMLENEKQVIDDLNKVAPNYPKHWMPIVWAAAIVTRARKEGRIRDDYSVKTIIDALDEFRRRCNVLMHYDNISVPLVYTQVVTLGTYSYIFMQAIGQQWINRPGEDKDLDLYFPYFTVLQFLFFMGWFKVAEVLINPFGDDDDDFELNWMIDRNLQISYLIVDEMHHAHPELVKDQYWDEVFPSELPYQDAKREAPPATSTAGLDFGISPSVTQLNGSGIRLLSSEQKLLTSAASDGKIASPRKPGDVRISDDKGEAQLWRRDMPTKQTSDTSLLVKSEPDEDAPDQDQLSAISDIFERLRKDRQKSRLQRVKDKWLHSVGKMAGMTDMTVDRHRPSENSEEVFDIKPVNEEETGPEEEETQTEAKDEDEEGTERNRKN